MILDNVVDDMVRLYNERKFIPQQEADIQSILYHLLLERGADLTRVHAGYPLKIEDRTVHPDLIIGDPENVAESELIEIKFMAKGWVSQPGRLSRRMETSVKDLTNLSKINCKKRRLLFFNESKPLSDRMKNRLIEVAKKTQVSLELLEREDERMVKKWLFLVDI